MSSRAPTTARLLLLAVLCAGCRDDPAVVFAEARQALQSRDEPAFLRLLEPRSAALLRASDKVIAKSGRAWKVLRDGRPSPALLPKGDIVGEPIENGREAVVMVHQGVVQRRVPMRLVQGQWRIDLLEMDTFYQLVRPAE